MQQPVEFTSCGWVFPTRHSKIISNMATCLIFHEKLYLVLSSRQLTTYQTSRLNFDAEISSLSTDWACKSAPNVQKKNHVCAMCAHSDWASIFACHRCWLGACDSQSSCTIIWTWSVVVALEGRKSDRFFRDWPSGRVTLLEGWNFEAIFVLFTQFFVCVFAAAKRG